MSDKVVIEKGEFKLEILREELTMIDETPDGVNFNFKGNIRLTFEDQHMPNDVKQRIKTADTSFKKGSLNFNLMNYRDPVLVQI